MKSITLKTMANNDVERISYIAPLRNGFVPLTGEAIQFGEKYDLTDKALSFILIEYTVWKRTRRTNPTLERPISEVLAHVLSAALTVISEENPHYSNDLVERYFMEECLKKSAVISISSDGMLEMQSWLLDNVDPEVYVDIMAA